MKNEQNEVSLEQQAIEFGERRISKMNFSYIVTLPKQFIQSTPYEGIIAVKIIMQKDGCLKLVPSRVKNGEEELSLISDP